MHRSTRTRVEGFVVFTVVSFAVALGLSYLVRMWLACVIAFFAGSLAERIYRGVRH